MATENGGFAFPWCGDLNETPTINLGMTLRDYFAGQALMGMMASRDPRVPRFSPVDDADYVYQIADAMIERRTA